MLFGVIFEGYWVGIESMTICCVVSFVGLKRLLEVILAMLLLEFRVN